MLSPRSGSSRPAPRALMLALLALAVAGCGNRYQKVWHEEEIEGKSEMILWELGLSTLSAEGYEVGAGTKLAERTIQSKWREELSPFRGRMGSPRLPRGQKGINGDSIRKGKRRRAIVSFERLGFQHYNIRSRVELEVNDDIIRPLDSSFAKWIPAPDDEFSARRIVWSILTRARDPLELRDHDGDGRADDVGDPSP